MPDGGDIVAMLLVSQAAQHIVDLTSTVARSKTELTGLRAKWSELTWKHRALRGEWTLLPHYWPHSRKHRALRGEWTLLPHYCLTHGNTGH